MFESINPAGAKGTRFADFCHVRADCTFLDRNLIARLGIAQYKGLVDLHPTRAILGGKAHSAIRHFARAGDGNGNLVNVFFIVTLKQADFRQAEPKQPAPCFAHFFLVSDYNFLALLLFLNRAYFAIKTGKTGCIIRNFTARKKVCDDGRCLHFDFASVLSLRSKRYRNHSARQSR